jgi:hypothetical protein
VTRPRTFVQVLHLGRGHTRLFTFLGACGHPQVCVFVCMLVGTYVGGLLPA